MGLHIVCPAWHDEKDYKADEVWRGAYSAFNRLRREIARATGGSYPPHAEEFKYVGDTFFVLGEEYTPEAYPGLFEFMSHSDFDGEISPEMCEKVAKDLREIAEIIKHSSPTANGHILKSGGYYESILKIIRGCEDCFKAGVSLKFC